MKSVVLGLAAALVTTSAAHASDYAGAMATFLEEQASAWINDPAVIDAIRAQNTANAGVTQSDIDAMEVQWADQVGTSDAPLVDSVLGHSAADFLRTQVDASGGAITEVFIMDQFGLNVAASHATSDVWQGDEAKFLETFAVGAAATHFSDIEFDESTQTYQGQISVSIVDPDTGAPIGAVTIGVDAEALL